MYGGAEMLVNKEAMSSLLLENQTHLKQKASCETESCSSDKERVHCVLLLRPKTPE